MTEWFTKLPGRDLMQSRDDPTMAIVADVPDWVTVPDSTGHGGRFRCLAVTVGPCPAAGHDHQCRHYVLDCPIGCAECLETGLFYWYKKETK